ncbi:MAG: hypothetical protein NWE86_05505, partial [Candidatus Bathyarchaeota archaeon]|nr:hypothetical protein [Candidatus Bathyarchaeota archaeon]
NIMKDWSTDNTWTWIPDNCVGTCKIVAWVRDGEHSAKWDDYEYKWYEIYGSSINQKPLITRLLPDRSDPQIVGTNIQWTCTVNDPDGPTTLYRYWLRKPDGTWNIMKDWSTDNTWTWSPDSSCVGNCKVVAWVKDGEHCLEWDDYEYEWYEIIPDQSNLPPSITDLSSDLSSPQSVGTSIQWTCTVNDPDGPTTFYKYWLRKPDGTWNIMRDWSTDNTWTWSPDSSCVGNCKVVAWVRDGEHSAEWDDYEYEWYEIISIQANQPPFIINLFPNNLWPITAGTSVIWTCIATDPDDDVLYYRYWLRKPDGTWHIMRDWDPDERWTWIPDSSCVGNCKIVVWLRDGEHSAEWDDYEYQWSYVYPAP